MSQEHFINFTSLKAGTILFIALLSIVTCNYVGIPKAAFSIKRILSEEFILTLPNIINLNVIIFYAFTYFIYN